MAAVIIRPHVAATRAAAVTLLLGEVTLAAATPRLAATIRPLGVAMAGVPTLRLVAVVAIPPRVVAVDIPRPEAAAVAAALTVAGAAVEVPTAGAAVVVAAAAVDASSFDS